MKVDASFIADDSIMYANVAIAIAQVLNNSQITVKIPNDLLIGHQKLCGILIEKIDDAFLIGIGLNSNSEGTIEKISLKALYGKAVDIQSVMASIISAIQNNLRYETAASLLTTYQQFTKLLNQEITVKHRRTNEQITGFVKNLTFDTITINNQNYNLAVLKF